MRMGLCGFYPGLKIRPKIAIIAAVGVGILFFSRVQPVFEMRASEFAKYAANRAINDAVSSVFRDVEYNDISSIRENKNGEITAVEMNSSKMNTLRADVTDAVLSDSENIKDGKIRIPLGSVLGNDLFAGLGPKITVKTVALNSVNVDFHDEFTNAGINQVKHKIYLDASVSVSVIGSTMYNGETISAQVPVAETVIVGSVPNYYSTDGNLNAVLE